MMYFPSFVYLYNGGRTESLRLEEVSGYLKNIFRNSDIQIRDDFVGHYLSGLSPEEKEKAMDSLAREIAGIKVRNTVNKDIIFEPLPGEIEYEKQRISDPQKKSFGILYDGFKLMALFSKLIPEEESDFNHCHIIFTNQLFGTWDGGDLRYHARVSVYGFPSVISTTGIVEAPAKPRKFYMKRRMGFNITTLKEEISGRFIDYDDPRMTEVMKGYALQAIFFQGVGEPFCDDKTCRLYNAHWQEELLQAQLSSSERDHIGLCPEHQKIITQSLS
ncbi:MAG: hypothetical protein JSU92_08970 [Deltaproteobacteria bacterium]|nr:MAG: hypothetical protein JSU92_08970 [Deltaproteobacteria bacterium]